MEKSDRVESHDLKKEDTSSASTISKPELLIATQIDPLLLLIFTLYSLSGGAEEAKGLFLSIDDILERVCENCPHFEQIVRKISIRNMMGDRLLAACDSVQAGEETMYRLNERKLLDELLAKAVNTVKKGLPKSMEEKFIKGTLDLPVTFLAREDTASSEQGQSQLETHTETRRSLESQSSVAGSDASSFAESTSTGVTTPDILDSTPITSESTPDTTLTYLLRVRTLLKYFLSSYIAPPIAARLQVTLDSDQSPINFKPLEERLALVSKLRAEAVAARSAGDFSRKRNAYEDDEMAEERAEKKRKKEDEERRKRQESRGIKNLKKADTTGMKKLSSFFGKKLAAKS